MENHLAGRKSCRYLHGVHELFGLFKGVRDTVYDQMRFRHNYVASGTALLNAYYQLIWKLSLLCQF